MNIEVKTNPLESCVVGKNGIHQLAAIQVWEGDNGKLFIDGIGRMGTVLNAGFVIDAKAAKILLAAIAECKFDIDS